MQVLASQLLFLANRNAGQAISPLCWPVNCIKIGGHVVLLSVTLLLIAYTVTLVSDIINIFATYSYKQLNGKLALNTHL